jgi:signal peptidase
MAKQKSKVMSTITTILSYVIMAILAVIIVITIIAKVNNKVPSIFGYSILKIQTGSMDMTIPTGSYIVVKKVSPEDVKVGDIITFYSDDPAISGMPNTHRVIGIKTGEDGRLIFQTKGDNNAIEDKYPADEESLVGVFQTRLALLSNISSMFGNSSYLIIIMLLAVAMICIFMSVSMFKESKKEESEEQEKQLPQVTFTEEDVRKYLEEKARLEEQNKANSSDGEEKSKDE